jgi:hypothetical protein
MDSLQSFKAKLALLDTMLSKMKSSHSRVRQLQKSIYILRAMLRNEDAIKSPYGPDTPIVRFSIQ